ncbi:MAG: DUF2933 domain-containing protein [Bacillota bacterium]
MNNMKKNEQNCHQDQNQNGEHKGFLKHGLMMMLCCLLPILLIAGLPLFGIKGGSLSSLIFLLCPLMHVGMMFMMKKSGKGGSCHGSDKNKEELDS